MPLVEPYAPCLCGSGEKYKWCCQKVEGYLEKALRLHQTSQVEAALSAYDEGLKKFPGNPLLTIRKAVGLYDQGQFEAARDLMEPVARANPAHPGVQSLFIRQVLDLEGPRAGVGWLQQALAALKPGARVPQQIVDLVETQGDLLAQSGLVPAGVAHLRLAEKFRAQDPDAAAPSPPLQSLLADQTVSLFLKAPYRLSPVPEGLDEPRRGRFSAALDKAARGLWGPAAADFDALAREGTPEADRNLGLCRLWLADHEGAVDALRRHTRWVGPTVDSVELEGLCQLIEPIRDEDRVELLQWIWPVRDRAALLQALESDDRIVAQDRQPVDANDPDSPEIDTFAMADRPTPARGTSVSDPDQLPRIEGRVLVTPEVVAVEAFDDGRLERAAERFKALAGESITPAHPRSREIGFGDRSRLALRREWVIPEGMTEEDIARLRVREYELVHSKVWPETPLPFLNGRSPRQAARDGDAELPLRAALSIIESNHAARHSKVVLPALRADLGVPAEPDYDPETVDLAEIPVTRLYRIDPTRLSDDRLVALFDLTEQYALSQDLLMRIARILVERPEVLDSLDKGRRRVTVYSYLASLEMGRLHFEEALAWLDRGRASDPAAVRETNAVRWDMMELRLRSMYLPPSTWVPFLASLLDRYGKTKGPASDTLLMTLVNMGLVEVQPNPDRPDDVVIDTRPLHAVIERFGPKVTTASGDLGVSVSGGQVWTPGRETGGPGGVWTPGQASQAGQPGEPKSKLILPGR